MHKALVAMPKGWRVLAIRERGSGRGARCKRTVAEPATQADAYVMIRTEITVTRNRRVQNSWLEIKGNLYRQQ